MKREGDVQLIHAVLSGDASAFDILVEKYEKSVHALAWQRIGDFHYAEEITQDTFLRAYQKLSTITLRVLLKAQKARRISLLILP